MENSSLSTICITPENNIQYKELIDVFDGDQKIGNKAVWTTIYAGGDLSDAPEKVKQIALKVWAEN